jgi:hypothetical protein
MSLNRTENSRLVKLRSSLSLRMKADFYLRFEYFFDVDRHLLIPVIFLKVKKNVMLGWSSHSVHV